MTDFREKLLKAGLVTTEQVAAVDERKAAPSGGRNNPRGGGRGAQRDRAEAQDPRELAAIAREALRVKRTPEERVALAREAKSLAKKGRLEGAGRGGLRWYYLSRTGELPWIELQGSLGDKVATGRAAIVEDPSGQSWVVGSETAQKLAEIDRAWIRHWIPASRS